MPRQPSRDGHPRGTLFLMALYGFVFLIAWLAVYLTYLYRGGVKP